MKPRNETHQQRLDRLSSRAAEVLALGMEKRVPITHPNDPPPCFESRKQYRDWLEMSYSARVPDRPDFKAEPNYCRDCLGPKAKWEMVSAGRCLFPDTAFKVMTDAEGDQELVGYTQKDDRVGE